MVRVINLKRIVLDTWNLIIDNINEHGGDYDHDKLNELYKTQTDQMDEECSKVIDLDEYLEKVKQINIYMNSEISKELEDSDSIQAKKVAKYLNKLNEVLKIE